jgi:hypothetical protein
MGKTTEMKKFKKGLMREIIKFFPDQRSRMDLGAMKRHLETVMKRIGDGMLSPAEVKFVKISNDQSALEALEFYRSSAEGCEKLDAEYEKSYKKLGGDEKWQALGGGVRLTELNAELARYCEPVVIHGITCEPHGLGNGGRYESLVLERKLDSLLLKIFDPLNSWVIDECCRENIDFVTDCRKLVIKYSHLFKSD